MTTRAFLAEQLSWPWGQRKTCRLDPQTNPIPNQSGVINDKHTPVSNSDGKKCKWKKAAGSYSSLCDMTEPSWSSPMTPDRWPLFVSWASKQTRRSILVNGWKKSKQEEGRIISSRVRMWSHVSPFRQKWKLHLQESTLTVYSPK